MMGERWFTTMLRGLLDQYLRQSGFVDVTML